MVAVIINPISGAGGRGDRRDDRVAIARAVLARDGIDPDISVTERSGHARVLAEHAANRGAALVVAWGGDGTINEVASALAYRRTPLAIVRAGSGNGLARELDIDPRPEVAIAHAIGGVDRVIDAGEIGGRLFVNIAGIGFDAHVAALFNQRAPGKRGVLPYAGLTLRELMSYGGADYTLTVHRCRAQIGREGPDGPNGGMAAAVPETIRMRAHLIAIANGSQYGSGARIAPQARLDDGRLDVVAVAPRSPIRALWELRRLWLGTVPQARGVVVRSIDAMSVASDAPMLAHVDGEPFDAAGPLEVRVHPRALVVRVPRP